MKQGGVLGYAQSCPLSVENPSELNGPMLAERNDLSAVCAALPDSVISGDGVTRLLDRVAHLPESALNATFGFESRLLDDQPVCDFFLAVEPDSDLARYFIELGKRENASEFDAGFSWYLREVERSDSFLGRWLSSAILECDVLHSNTTGPEPMGVFIEAHRHPSDAHHLVQRTRKLEKLGNPGVMTAALCGAIGREENANVRQYTELLFANLPENSGCSHVGAFPSRDSVAVRIVFSMDMSQAVDFLRRVHWEGELSRLERIFGDISGFVHRIGLSCDVLPDGLSSRVGFELFQRRNWLGTPIHEWRPMFDYFLKTGLANPSKVRAFKTWPTKQLLFGKNGTFQLRTGINHLKLVMQDASSEVKAYVGARLTNLNS